MNWSTLPYKKKLLLLRAAIGLTALLVYFYGIAPTLREYRAYKENNNKVFALQTNPQMKPSNELQPVKQILDSISSDSSAVILQSLNYLTQYCKNNQLKLAEYKPLPPLLHPALAVTTRKVTVEGSYIPLLKLLYDLETQQHYGMLSSAQFKATEDFGSNKVILNCTFYLQNLININHEKE